MGRKQYAVFAGLLIAGVALITTAFVIGRTHPPDAALRIPGVEALVPERGSEVLQQQRIAIDLEPSFIVRSFTVSPDARCAAPVELVDFIDKVGGVNMFVYQPDEGKPVEQLSPDNNCVRVIIEDLQRPGDTHEVVWEFTVN